MNRTIIVVVAASGLLLQDAVGHEVRHSSFPTALIGSWAETTERCATKDKSNISIESAKYGDTSGTCAVFWIVETPAPKVRATPSMHGAPAQKIKRKLKP